ncbi:MAG: DNA adenine methylase [Eubacteriales bacterium]|nr:DNA adenine methylase [Eubacteriales bacterium]
MEALITWMGGKKQLREVISRQIPEDISGYIEPFGGAGWVMLYRERWARLEVWNDLDNDLYNMFMQVKFHPEELMRELEGMLHSRRLFSEMLKNRGITEIQRAARFVYLVRHSFGALKSSFGTGKTQSGGVRMSLAQERILPLAKRLDMVTVENLDYRECISKYDSAKNFFYVDPPYYKGHTYENSRGFDHEELRNILESVHGRWLLSYDDCSEIRELYQGFKIVPVVRKKGITRAQDDFRELIIMNYGGK